MLFPLVYFLLVLLHIPFGIGCVTLMLLGAQWYILFNVVAGASSIPSELKEGCAVFGLSRSLPLSLLALFIIGAVDMVSVVIRSSVLQLGTPPEMRGRVSAVNSLFVGASNELGEFESGLTAQWWGAVRAVVIGGIGSLAVTGIWSLLFPALRNADQLTPEALLNVEVEQLGQEVRQL